MFHELGDVLTEKGKGRVGDNDVRFFQELDALGAAVKVEGANPHETFVTKLEKLRAAYESIVKKRDETELALENIDDLPDPPKDASDRMEKIAKDNKDCQAADFAFGS